MKKEFEKLIVPISDKSFQEGKELIDKLFPISKQYKDINIIEHDASPPAKKPTLDEINSKFKKDVMSISESSMQAGKKLIDELFSENDLKKDTPIIKDELLTHRKHQNSNKI